MRWDHGMMCCECIYFEKQIPSGPVYSVPAHGLCRRFPPDSRGDFAKITDSEANWCREYTRDDT